MIAGVDEAGRGPLVGSVFAAAVILDDKKPIQGLADSKKMSAKQRENLFSIICSQARCWSVASSSAQEIDEINILQATLLAMQRAVNKLTSVPEKVLVDGNQAPKLSIPVETIIKGDSKVQAISAASILAKVCRDKQMLELDKKFPQYEFARHKGYPTKKHLQLLKQYGPCAEYRFTYKPVKEAVKDHV